MARSGDPDEGEGEIWGTWEELLLASAVSRHGTRRWDSVAMEVQSRIPASSANLLTPLRCRQRFHLLQNRFSTATVAVTDGEPDGEPLPDIPWLEDLRKLRVAELRREVERSDLSIRNLQIKVERLKGERERIAGEAEHGGGEADLKSGEGRKGSGGSTPETLAGDRISGRSCKESNSTDPKEDGRKPGEDAENAKDTAGDGKRKMDPVAGERSDDRSSAAGDPDPADPRESGESAAESKGGEAEERERDGEKESSEVQSSASLTRRRRMGRRRKAPSVSSSGAAAAEEPETDVVSPHAASVPSTASQPLVSFLEIIRSSKPGSVFARRLDSQKTAKYKSLIRRHVDLEMVTRRIERSGGAYTSLEFFRDLLLLCNNAIVFYAKSSDEAIAAVHLRDLISKEMTATGKQKPDEAPPAPPPPLVQPPPAAKAPPPQPAKLKEDPDLARSLLEKSTSAAPLITCRKRSSISAKKADPDRKEEKPEPDRKERDAEDPTHKKKTKERSSFPPARGFRTNKMRALPKNSNPDSASNLNAQVAEAAEADSTPKVEKKNTPNGGSAASLSKKRSATSFLNRMKRSSPSNGTLLESLKSSGAAASSGGKTTDQKKSGKGESRKEQGSKSGATAKQTPEPSAPTKRSVGRPPKRGAAPPSKRAREEAEGSKPTPPARKRGRR